MSINLGNKKSLGIRGFFQRICIKLCIEGDDADNEEI